MNEISASEILDRIATLEGDVFELKTENASLREELSKQKETNSIIKEQIKNEQCANRLLKRDLNNLEQYTRGNNIRIFGLRDTQKNETAFQTEQKVISLLRNKMGISLDPCDVEVAHRLGSFTANADRPVIVRFVSRKTKAGHYE